MPAADGAHTLGCLAIRGDPRTCACDLGIAAGTAGSGIGASLVIPQHPLAAPFAGLAIGLNVLLTAVLALLISLSLRH